MKVLLAVAAPVNCVFINEQDNIAAGGPLNKHGQYILPIANYPEFIMNQYQEVGQKPVHTATKKKQLQLVVVND